MMSFRDCRKNSIKTRGGRSASVIVAITLLSIQTISAFTIRSLSTSSRLVKKDNFSRIHPAPLYSAADVERNVEGMDLLQHSNAVAMVEEMAQEKGIKKLVLMLDEKIGVVNNDRILFPDYDSGEVPRMFSSLKFDRCEQGKVIGAAHAAGSVLAAAALVAGTTIGAGILALPAATVTAGFLPSSAALTVAWIYMTMSGLLIAELTINRIGETGRPGLGLLELYDSSLGTLLSLVGKASYFFLHYAMMVAYIAQGGSNVTDFFGMLGLGSLVSIPGAGQLAFALVCGLSLFWGSTRVVGKVNSALVLGVFATFAGIIGLGAQSADFHALFDSANQHPDQVVSCFPILFLALVYQNVVPSIVTQLEGDRSKIIQAIIGGTTAPFLMFLAWNAIVLGNVLATHAGSTVDPVALLQSGVAGGAEILSLLVGVFSSLALVTSIIGFTISLESVWTDVFNIKPQSEQFTRWKPVIFALIFCPPLALSVSDPDIFFKALEYGGAFGVSTLFLVLPPIMVWKERYNNTDKPLMTKPLVPLGKLPLGSMWKAAATLILEQGAEKLGIVDFLTNRFHG